MTTHDKPTNATRPMGPKLFSFFQPTPGVPVFSNNAPLEKIKARFQDFLKPAAEWQTRVSVEVATIDHLVNPQVNHSAVALCFIGTTEGLNAGQRITQVVLIEGVADKTEPPLEVHEREPSGKPVAYTLFSGTTTEQYKREYLHAAREICAPMFGAATVAKYHVVPAIFNWGDYGSVRGLVSALLVPILAKLLDPKSDVIDLVEAGRDYALVVQASLDPQPHKHWNALPVRSDLKLSLGAKQRESSRSTNSANTAGICNAHGFIDLLWMGQKEKDGVDLDQYLGELVITDLSPVNTVGMETSLLGLLATSALAKDRLWQRSLAKQLGGATQRDIRAINPTLYLPHMEGETMEKHNRGLEAVFKGSFENGLSIAIDVPLAGPVSEFDELLLEAAKGDRSASSEIIRRANGLTQGKLGNLIRSDDTVVLAHCEKVHLGYFEKPDGELRDLREIDLLYLLNNPRAASGYNEGLAQQYSDTFNQLAVSQMQRLAQREALYRNVQPNVVFTGYAHRIRLTKTFFTGLSDAMCQMPCRWQLTLPAADAVVPPRAAASFARASVPAARASQMFNEGFSAQGHYCDMF